LASASPCSVFTGQHPPRRPAASPSPVHVPPRPATPLRRPAASPCLAPPHLAPPGLILSLIFLCIFVHIYIHLFTFIYIYIHVYRFIYIYTHLYAGRQPPATGQALHSTPLHSTLEVVRGNPHDATHFPIENANGLASKRGGPPSPPASIVLVPIRPSRI